MNRVIASFIATTSILCTTPATAAEIKVISAGAVRSVIAGMIEDYRTRSGDTFDFTSAPPANCVTSSRPASRPTSSSPRRR